VADVALDGMGWRDDALEHPGHALVNTELGSLRKALAGDALPARMNALEQIWYSWTNLEACTLRLAALVSASFPLPRGMRIAHGDPANLLGECVNAAIDAYRAARIADRDETGPPRAFLHGLLTAADGLSCYDVFGRTGDRSARWEVGTVPLTTFARDWENVVFAPVLEPGRLRTAARVVLIGALLRLEDAALLGKNLESQRELGSARGDRKVISLFPRPLA